VGPLTFPWRALRRARLEASSRLPRARAAILLYHRVAVKEPDPWGVAVPPQRFRDHMDLLAGEFRPLPLRELAACARAGRLPQRAVAVTFDDGYLDNLEAALPELERTRVPATVFAATEYIETGRSFWWDELDALLLGRGNARPGEHAEAQALLRRTAPAAVEPAMARLRERFGPAEPAGRPMSVEELRSLSASGLVEIGAHTRSHAGLAWLHPGEVEQEVRRSRDDLATWLGDSPSSFSYPFGDGGLAPRRAVARAGFRVAVGTVGAPVTRLSDRLDLPRLWVHDEDASRLRDRLESLLRR
jgi:peptidoglycan/xylan/chitin deacetylase (PgdA/CDA1 family)